MVAPLSRLSQLERTILLYRQALLRADNAALTQLQAAYQPSRERLLEQIEQTVARIAADGITTAKAAQLGRARELLRLVEVEVGRLAQVAGQTIPTTQAQVVAQALERARMLTIAQGLDIRQASRLSAQWTALNTNAVTDLVGSLSDGSPLDVWLKEFVEDSVQVVKDTLVDGVARGIGPEALGRELAQATDLPLHRAMTLARTETMHAYRSAGIAAMQANDDILSGWQWSCAPSGACLACQAKDGATYPLRQSFFPGHPRCITGDTRIQAEGVKAVSKRWYSGRIIEIETMRGHRLTVTPNHPLLTPEGWIAAGLVKEGDDLISSNGEQWSLIGDDHDKDIPPRVEEVTRALSMTSGVIAVEVPSATPHFHGDGIEGEIDVVYADGELGNRIQTALAEQFGDRHFVMTDMGLVPLATGSHALLEIDRLGDTTHRVMRSGRETLPFIGGHLALSQIHTGAPIPWRHTCQDQPATNDGSGYPEMRGGRLLGLPKSIERYDRVVIDPGVGAISGGTLFGNQPVPLVFRSVNTALNQDTLQTIGAESTNAITDRLHAFPGAIAPDRIVKLVNRAFSGHVYNLESEQGYYFASGIVTHNCRCSPLPVLKDAAMLARLETASERFYALPMGKQLDQIPLGARGDFEAGRLRLEDFIHEDHDETWGTSVRQASITQARANAARRRSGGSRLAAGGR